METIPKTTFALFFGNRGFFPASLIAQARREMQTRLEPMGHKVLMLDEKATRHGAVETPRRGPALRGIFKSTPRRIRRRGTEPAELW